MTVLQQRVTIHANLHNQVIAMVSGVHRKPCSRTTGYELRRCCYCSYNIIWFYVVAYSYHWSVLSYFNSFVVVQSIIVVRPNSERFEIWMMRSMNLAIFTYAPQPQVSTIRLWTDWAGTHSDDEHNFEQSKAIGQSGQSVLSGQWAPLHSHACNYKEI